MKKIYKWLIGIVMMALLMGWQYDVFQKSLHEVESRIKKFESVDLFNHIESVDILNEKQMELQALEEEIKEKFVIQESKRTTKAWQFCCNFSQ